MAGRFFLLLTTLVFAVSGCAIVSEERISMLESAVMDLQARDMRLTSLEATVATLVAETVSGKNRPAPQESATPQNRLGPRRVYAEPTPAAAASTPDPAPVAAVPPQSAPAPVTAVSPPSTPVAVAPQPAPAPVKKAGNTQVLQRYQAALVALEGGRPQAALGQFREFLALHPGHTLAPNAAYWLGECHYSMKQYNEALMAFKDVVAQYPRHDKAAAAMLKAGYSYALLGDAANARFYLEMLIKDFPSSQPSSLARARLAAL